MVFQGLPTSARLEYFPPTDRYDDEVYSIYCEQETMKFIPFLCAMSANEWSQRRTSHREMWANDSGAFFDVVERGSGSVVGTSGFRVIDKASGHGEWGIVLSAKWQKRGFCREIHDACMQWAREQELTKATARTWASNARMIELLEAYGWTYIETIENDYGTWREYHYMLTGNKTEV